MCSYPREMTSLGVCSHFNESVELEGRKISNIQNVFITLRPVGFTHILQVFPFSESLISWYAQIKRDVFIMDKIVS